MKLTEACIEKPVFAWMLMAATIVFGAVAASRIGVSQYPDVDFPTITVSVNWEGAAPEVMENDVVELIEEAVVQVEGVRTITSTARQGARSQRALARGAPPLGPLAVPQGRRATGRAGRRGAAGHRVGGGRRDR